MMRSVTLAVDSRVAGDVARAVRPRSAMQSLSIPGFTGATDQSAAIQAAGAAFGKALKEGLGKGGTWRPTPYASQPA